MANTSIAMAPMFEVSTDKKEVMSVISHPSIWPNIAPENCNPEDFTPPDDNDYLIFRDGGELAGCYIFHETELGYKIHANMIKRGEYADKAAAAAIRWAFENRPIDALVCEIPTRFANVHAYALRNGFVDDRIENENHIMILERAKWGG